MNYSAVIVAAGSGSRMGLGYNKQLYILQDQKTVIETTVDIFLQDKRCQEIIVVVSTQDLESFQKLFSTSCIKLVLGGDTRQMSVWNGLQAVTQKHVLIHDGARPWLPMACIDRLLHTLQRHPACLLCVPVKDTIKQVKDGKIIQTLPRAELFQAQTPQAFETALLYACYEKAMQTQVQATDDAQLVELYGNVAVEAVEGSYENSKITTMEDLHR